VTEGDDAVPDRPTAPPAQRPVIVSRTLEQHELTSAIDRARDGRGSLVWLAGEPGIGKSTLAELATRHAADVGMLTLWGNAWPDDGAPPFWPWVQVLRGLREAVGADEITALTGDLVADLGPFARELGIADRSAGDADRFRMFDATTRTLVRAARSRPMLIVLDDLHWADGDTVELLRFVVRELRNVPMAVVSTYRDVEVGSEHPLSQVLGRIGSDPIHLQLGPLDVEAVGELLALTTGSRPTADFASSVAADAGGNPFFVRELGRLLNHPTTGRPIPSNIRQVVLDRVAGLPPASAEALRSASVLGVTFPVADLAAVLATSLDATVSTLHPAAQLRLVHLDALVDDGQRCSFVHALVSEVLYAELPPLTRAQLHARIAEAMDRSAAGATRLAERASHWARAVPVSGPEPALAAALAAADEATAQLAHEQAASHLERAAQLQAMRAAADAADPGRDPRPDAAERGELLLRLARAQQTFAHRKVVKATRREIARLSEIAQRPDLIARAALSLSEPFIGIGTDPEEVEILERVVAVLPDEDSALRARAMAKLSSALLFRVDETRRAQLAEQAVAMARRLDHPATLGRALIEQANGTWAFADPERRLEMTNEVVAIAERLRERDLGLYARLTRLGTLLMLGDGRSFRVELDAFDRVSTRARQHMYTRITPLLRATVATIEGRWSDAEACIAEASEQIARSEDDSGQLGVMAATAALYHVRGHAVRVGRGLANAARQFPASMSMAAGAGLVEACAGRHDAAREHLARVAADAFATVPRDYNWLTAVFDAALIAVVVDDGEVAASARDRLRPFGNLIVISSRTGVACLGSVGTALGLLSEQLGDLDDAAEMLAASVRRCDELGAPVFAADARWALARVLDRRGAPDDHAEAAEHRAIAVRLATELGIDLPLNGIEPAHREIEAHSDAGSTSTRVEVPAAGTDEPTATRDEDGWVLHLDDEVVRVRHSVGLDHLVTLLRSPRTEVHVLDLAGAREADDRDGHDDRRLEPAVAARGRVSESIIDDAARRAYLRRIDQLREELDAADRADDPARSARAQDELDALTAELRRATGLGGRERLVADDGERARVAVTKAIRGTIRRIGERSPVLGAHFEHTVRTGMYCSYDGERAWRIER